MFSYRILIPVCLVLAWVGCSRDTDVTVANHSSGVITNIMISGSGFSERIESLASGSERRLIVHPRGESGVRVAFDAGDRHVDSEEQDYFEVGGSYRVAVIIEPDLKVTVSVELAHY